MGTAFSPTGLYVVSYDPADSENDPYNAPTEWLYIKRDGEYLCEGGVKLSNDNPELALYRMNVKDQDLSDEEIILPTADALVGVMLVRLMEAVK